MAPKKNAKSSSSAKGVAQVRLSADAEKRLSKLVADVGSKAPAPAPAAAGQSAQGKKNAVKRLKKIYDGLSNEGFSVEHVELALAAIPTATCTMETALDWLCLNLPPNELPIKFSSGITVEDRGGTVQVLSASQPEVAPQPRRLDAGKDFTDYVKVEQTKLQAQPDIDAEKMWIRQYMAQQEEEETDSDWEDSADRTEMQVHFTKVSTRRRATDPAERREQIAEEFTCAKQAAADAKSRGDKQSQAEAGRLIRSLKEEMASMGINEQDLLSKSHVQAASDVFQQSSQEMPALPKASEAVEVVKEEEVEALLGMSDTEFAKAAPVEEAADSADCRKQVAEGFTRAKQVAEDAKSRGDKQSQAEAGSLIRSLKEEMASLGLNEQDLLSKAADDVFQQDEETSDLPKAPEAVQVVEEEEEGLSAMFDDESEGSQQTLPTSILRLQRKEKLVAWGTESTSKSKQPPKKSSKVHEEARKTPRAMLQQYCLKNGWSAPKYEKLAGGSGAYQYSVTVARPAVGRGKNKRMGGPVTYTLPDHEDPFHSTSDAQDAVATWAILSLFPDLPLYRLLLEPFQSMWLRWHTEGETVKDQTAETRDVFIETLLDSSSQEQQEVMPPSEILKVPDSKFRPASSTTRLALPFANGAENSARLRLLRERKSRDTTFLDMCSKRSRLPIAGVKEVLLEALRESNVVVVSGETGSGKTTQVPQYILDDMIETGRGGYCNIICTQPRRIAAISVAERVAAERCEPAPGNAGSSVGYQVRLDASWGADTRLLFCTTGILLRRLARDRKLSDVSHVVVDEVHERTALGDFLMTLLRDLLQERNADDMNPLKVILMSATLDSEKYSRYFGGCPVILAEGRTFPVTTFYLEDVYDRLAYRLSSDNPAALQNSSAHAKKSSRHLVDYSRGRQNLASSGWGDENILQEVAVNPHYNESMYHNYSESTRANLAKVNEDVIDYELLEDLILHIHETQEPGALLVFLPGMPEIQQLLDRLSVLKVFSGAAAEWLLPLHSSIAPNDQRKVFQKPPKGIRKIVLATNIAETSVTIEDVVHVVDCGKHKENRFDPRRRMTRMVEAWISQANARQRKGRAGRVRAGNCFSLYTRFRFEALMHEFQLPEILRVPLVELCLQIKLLAVENMASFLQKALDPPKAEAVESALSTLQEVGAVDDNEELTPLGYHLAALPVDVHIGKIMLYGVLLGCVSPVLTIAAYLSHKSPFVAPIGQREAAERARHAFAAEGGDSNVAAKQQSDHLVIVAAYNGWRRIMTQGGARAARQFCDANFLSVPVLNMLREMRGQFAKLLRDIGFIKQIDSLDAVDNVKEAFNKNAKCAPVIKSVLCAGLYPNIAAMMDESILAGHANALNQRAGLASNKQPRWSDGRREVFIHPSSINSKCGEFLHPYLVFHEKVETGRVYLRDTTVLSPFSLLLFGGTIKVQHQTGLVTVDEWMKMEVPPRTAVLFRELRQSLDSILDELINSPQGLSSTKAKQVVSSTLELLMEVEQP